MFCINISQQNYTCLEMDDKMSARGSFAHMNKWIKRLWRGNFAKNVIIIATGTAAAQIITLILTPVIARIYGPEAIGVLGTFTSIITIISPIAALTYPIAIVLPKHDQEALGLVRLSFRITFIMVISATLFILIFRDLLIGTFNLHGMSFVLYLLPIVILFSSLTQIAEQWLIRVKQFKTSAKATFWHSVILNGGKVGLGLFQPVGVVLIMITMVGQLLKATMMFIGARAKWKRNTTNTIEIIQTENSPATVSLVGLLRRYKDFPIFRAPQILLNSVSQGLPIFMLNFFFGPAAAGFYTLGKNMLSIPSQLIAKSVGDVFYPRISEAYKNGENIASLLTKATLILTVIGFIPFGTIVAFAPQLFSLVFGSEWIQAGEYARWMALWIFVSFMNRPSVSVIQVIGLQDKFLLYEIISTVVRIGALYIGYGLFRSDLVSIALYSITGVLLNLYLILYTIIYSRSSVAKLAVREG